mgnify:CR=1 FL=1
MNISQTIVPDGEYACQLVSIERTVDLKNRVLILCNFRVAEGFHADEVLTKRYYMVSQPVADLLKRDLGLLGITASNKEELETAKQKVYGKRVLLTAAVNEGGFQCYYIKQVLDGVTPPETQSSHGW